MVYADDTRQNQLPLLIVQIFSGSSQMFFLKIGVENGGLKMKQLDPTCTSSNRHDHTYVCQFDAVELDLLYELARNAHNTLVDPESGNAEIEAGSWADEIIKLNAKLTEMFHRRRQ
jgi:hypothetical protein